jgi:hypothetical protein
VDSIVALKSASKGLPNALLRDLNAVHPNTTLEDLPPEVRAAISESVRAAFTRLRKEGYTVAMGGAAPPPPPRNRPSGGPAPIERKRRPPLRTGKGPPPKPR